MRKIQEVTPYFSMYDVADILDTRIKTVEVPCYHCGYHTTLTEVYINQLQSDEIRYTIDSLNDCMRSVQEAVIEIYGHDPRITLLNKKLQAIKDNFSKPKIRVIK